MSNRIHMAFTVLLLSVMIQSSSLADATAPPNAAVAIVVHADTTVTDLTMAQLRRIFLAEQQFWPDKSRITLLVRAPGAYERELVLDRIYEMNEDRFRKYWIAKMFRAEVPSGPKIVFSSNMAFELVTAIPGSITFMNSADVTGVNDHRVKVIRIDGLLPGEPGYPLE
jgi:ABC-type phosphate transport system substrate-binding protein